MKRDDLEQRFQQLKRKIFASKQYSLRRILCQTDLGNFEDEEEIKKSFNNAFQIIINILPEYIKKVSSQRKNMSLKNIVWGYINDVFYPFILYAPFYFSTNDDSFYLDPQKIQNIIQQLEKIKDISTIPNIVDSLKYIEDDLEKGFRLIERDPESLEIICNYYIEISPTIENETIRCNPAVKQYISTQLQKGKSLINSMGIKLEPEVEISELSKEEKEELSYGGEAPYDIEDEADIPQHGVPLTMSIQLLKKSRSTTSTAKINRNR